MLNHRGVVVGIVGTVYRFQLFSRDGVQTDNSWVDGQLYLCM
jgi:hypothetical protein